MTCVEVIYSEKYKKIIIICAGCRNLISESAYACYGKFFCINCLNGVDIVFYDEDDENNDIDY